MTPIVRRVSLGLALLVCCAGASASGDVHWSYGGHGGPAEWAALNAEFATCKLGKHQSPIDIRGAKAADLPAIAFNYQPAPLAVIDNGHTIQVNYAPGSWIDVGGVRYDLVQFHFHKPSEEKIDGKSHAMVAHLVHKNAAGKLAVVAVLLDGGGASATIDAIWKNLPGREGEGRRRAGRQRRRIDVVAEGSRLLHVPGFADDAAVQRGRHWLVLKAPLKIADGEIAQFAKIYPMNARPTQPTNGRPIEESH